MASELFTSWGEYQTAIDHILAMTQTELCIYDNDLSQLKLENGNRHELLRQFLQEHHGNRLQIALRNANLARDKSPRLMQLLSRHSDRMQVTETSDNLAHRRDSMILADRKHGLIRFEQDLARCKLVTQDEEGMASYRLQFQEIWQEGGTPISATMLGL